MKKLLSIILSITMLLTISTAVFADGVDGHMQPDKIKVGINAEFKPFEYYDENGNLTGFDIDLMNCIGERIGFEIEYVEFPFDRLHLAVTSGEVDCAISAITVTDERKQLVDFSEIYLDTYEQIDETSSQIVNYAIIFPGNSSEKEKLIEASGDKTNVLIYTLVNNAIKELKNNATIEKLLEKYDIPKANYAGAGPVIVGYDVVPTDEENKTSGTSVPYSDWAKSDIEKAIALNIINVGGNYNFPAPITREEFCELIYNYCYNVVKEVDTVTGENKFTDTTNSKIIRLNAMGIINGKSETEFAPNDLLTREEAAVILNRMVNKTIPVPVTEMYFNFDDEASISDWASDSIQVMCNMGVMNGVGENKFAPQDTYTTEQAIVTIVRVYASQSANTGIIGGTDAPTRITVIVTKKVDDFYIDEAIKLIKESAELASDKEFIGYYTANEEMTNKVLELGSFDYSKPTEIYYMSANCEQIINNIKALSDEELDGFDIEKLLKLNRVDFSVIGNMINASYGADNLAALTILTNSRGYIMPKDFTDDFAIYLQYDGDYSALVSFSKFGDDVIKATMQFVINGDKDNIFSRLYEITQGLGEDSIDVTIVK